MLGPEKVLEMPQPGDGQLPPKRLDVGSNPTWGTIIWSNFNVGENILAVY